MKKKNSTPTITTKKRCYLLRDCCRLSDMKGEMLGAKDTSLESSFNGFRIHKIKIKLKIDNYN